MPTYEYRCNACSKNFEYQQRMSDDDLVTCEACGQPKLEKLISRTAFTLKGSGWYRDLYSSPPAQATESKPAEAKSESKGDASGGSSSGSSSGSSDGGSSSGSSDSGSSSSSGSSSDGGSTTSSAAKGAP